MSDYEDDGGQDNNYDDDFIDDDDDDDANDDADSDHSVKNSKRKKGKGTKGKKKSKKGAEGARAFLDLYAAEDDEDDEEEEEELSEREKKELARQRARLQAEYAPKTKGPSFMDVFDKGGDVEEYLNNAEEVNEDNELALLPSNADPKLFVVKCKPNEERECCMQITRKYFECLGTEAEFEIFSCTAIDKSTGYIYIEAYGDKHVYVAIANVPNVYGSKINIVSHADRTQIFESDPTKSVEVKIGQWVRIKKGLYEGDVAQVEDIDEMKGTVEVRLVPRLPLAGEEPTEEEEENKTGEKKKGAHLQKAREAKNKIKPPQRLFQENEHHDWEAHRNVERGLSFILYKRNKYCEGLLYKKFPLKNLETQNITVTYDESKYFVGEHTDVGVLSTLIEQAQTKPTKFFKGDRIKVIRGDTINLEGEILKISPVALTVRPIGVEYNENMEIAPYDCVKLFKKGEYVRVVDGKNAGKEGFVMSVEENNIATLMSDGLQNVIQVFVNDLVFCNESTRNIEVKSKKDKEIEQEYVKFDLIKLNDRKTVGIVLGTASNGWKVLDNFGNVRTVTAYQIEQKLNTKNNMTKNDKAQTFRLNDSVRILQGKYKGQTGIAKHIYSDLIFIYNPDVAQNMGVIIEKANNCFLLSAQRQAGAKAAGPKGKDDLIGQPCVIKSGPWKGYRGKVRDGNEKTVRLELFSKCQIIDVRRELVIRESDIGKNTEPAQGTTANNAINLEPKTPMISRVPQSPYFDGTTGGFVNSPAYGFGFESPAYDAHMK